MNNVTFNKSRSCRNNFCACCFSALIFGLLGCTQAERDLYGSYGEPHKVTLYSGGKVVKEWTTEGKVQSESNSDGYFFRAKESGELIRVTGDVVIEVVK